LSAVYLFDKTREDDGEERKKERISRIQGRDKNGILYFFLAGI
jgi:hypothetical protein